MKPKENAVTHLIDGLLLLYTLGIYLLSVYEETNRYFRLLAFALMGMCTFYMLIQRCWRVGKQLLFFAAFVLFCVLSLLWAQDMTAAGEVCWSLVQLLVLSFLLYNYLEEQEKQRYFLFVLCVSGVVFALYTVALFGVEAYLEGLINGTRMGTEDSTLNTIGTATATSALICLWYIVYEKCYLCLVPMALCVVVGLGTGSRKTLIALMAGAVLLFLLRGNRKKRLWGLVEVIAVLFLLYQLLQLPLFSGIHERFEMMLNAFIGEGTVDTSTQKRLEMISFGMEQFYRTPFCGMGIGNTGLLTLVHLGRSTYLHNNYVELLASVGVIGTALYYAMYLVPLPWLWRGMRRRNSLAVLALSLLLVELILHYGMVTFYNKAAYLMLLFFALAANEEQKAEGRAV